VNRLVARPAPAASARSGGASPPQPGTTGARSVALPLDQRGQIPGQLDLVDVLAERSNGCSVAAPERMVALTAIHRSKSDRFGLGPFGVDTVKFRFRPAVDEFVDGLLRQPHRWAGGAAVMQEKPAGIVVTVSGSVVGVEGRLDPLLTGCRDTFGLRPLSDVRAGEEVALALIEDMAGVRLDGGRGYYADAEIGRLDLAHEFEFDEQAEGLAFLDAVAALHPARRKSDVIRAEDGTVQTVYFRSTKALVAKERVYDKGVESGSHAAGLRVRFETQQRFQKGKAPQASHFGGEWAARQYGGAVVGYTHTESVAVGRQQAEQQLLGAAGRGELSLAKAERMLGTLAVLNSYGRGVYGDQQGRRRLADLRRHGVSPESAVGPDRIVPVGRMLRESIESWSANGA